MTSFIAPSGREWSYAVAGELSGDGSGKEPLILLHGWSMSATSFTPLMPLIDQRFTIYNFDLPGHGDSPSAEDVSVAGFAEDIAYFIDLHIDSKPLLAGWSLGGQVALQLAANHPESLTGLILLATTPKFVQGDGWPLGQKATQVKLMIRGMVRNAQATVDAFRKPIADEPEYVAIYGDTPSYPDAGVATNLLQELIDVDLRPLLTDIVLPTLIIHGRDDAVIPVTVADYLTEQLHDASLVLVEGEHAPQLIEPQSVADALLSWRGEATCR